MKMARRRKNHDRLLETIVNWLAGKTRDTGVPDRDFECLDCHLIAPLNLHGRCRRCDSNGVIQVRASAMVAKRVA